MINRTEFKQYKRKKERERERKTGANTGFRGDEREKGAEREGGREACYPDIMTE